MADLVLSTELDRAFWSAKDTYGNLAYLDQHKVGFTLATPADPILRPALASYCWVSWRRWRSSSRC